MHELGKPLPVADLRSAAIAVHADYVVAPDLLGEPERNLAWYRETDRAMGNDFGIAVALAGRTPEERTTYLANVRYASMICLPFREPRWEWFLEQPLAMLAFPNIHLLGVNDLLELVHFTAVAEDHSEVQWSVDTAKPIKWAYAEADMERMFEHDQTLRGASLSSDDLLNITSMSAGQMSLVFRNTNFLRKFLG
jgi:hypothetical protein